MYKRYTHGRRTPRPRHLATVALVAASVAASGAGIGLVGVSGAGAAPTHKPAVVEPRSISVDRSADLAERSSTLPDRSTPDPAAAVRGSVHEVGSLDATNPSDVVSHDVAQVAVGLDG